VGNFSNLNHIFDRTPIDEITNGKTSVITQQYYHIVHQVQEPKPTKAHDSRFKPIGSLKRSVG